MNAWNNSVWYRESHSARELLNTFPHPVNIFCNVFDLVLLTNLTLSISTYSLFSIHTKKSVIFLLKNILIYNFIFILALPIPQIKFALIVFDLDPLYTTSLFQIFQFFNFSSFILIYFKIWICLLSFNRICYQNASLKCQWN